MYIDGISNDGKKAISITVLLAPYFHLGIIGQEENPSNHVCINVAMYGKGWRWTMTERGAKQLQRDKDTLKVGPSFFIGKRSPCN